jgi:hypothetical protein
MSAGILSPCFTLMISPTFILADVTGKYAPFLDNFLMWYHEWFMITSVLYC